MRLHAAIPLLALALLSPLAAQQGQKDPTPHGTHAEDGEKAREEAIARFKAGEYEVAYALLEPLAYARLADLRLQFYLGRAAYETGRFEEAASAFERVLIARPGDPVATYQLARCYYMLHDDTDAVRLFKKLRHPGTPPKIRQEAAAYLAKLYHRRSPHTLHGSLLVGAGYDSNAYNSPNTDRFYLPAYQIDIRNTTSDRGDGYHQEALQLHHLYDFGEVGGFAFRQDAAAYFQTLFDISANNLVYLNYAPALLYLRGRWLCELTLGADKMLFGSDPYLHTFYLIPAVEYRQSETLSWRASATLQRKVPDSDEYAGYKANYAMFTLSLTHHGEKWLLEAGGGGIRERKVDSDLTNVSHDAAFGYLDATRQLGPKDAVGASLFYRHRWFKDEDLFFLERRDEDYLSLRLRYVHAFTKSLRVECNADRIDNDSNIAPYDYTKHNVVVNLIKEF